MSGQTNKNSDTFRTLTPAQRLAEARARTERLVQEISNLAWTHHNVRLLALSPTVAKKIPRSYAATAFNSLIHDLVAFEFVRLLAAWDKPGRDRASIPTILALMNEDQTRSLWTQEVDQKIRDGSIPAHGQAHDEETEFAIRESLTNSRLQTMFPRTISYYMSAEKRAQRMVESDFLGAARTMRDRQLAHNLHLQPSPDEIRVRYVDLRRIFIPTVSVLHRLHSALNDTDMDFRGTIRQARKHATTLWQASSFDIPARESP